jgi:hypothetical protein
MKKSSLKQKFKKLNNYNQDKKNTNKVRLNQETNKEVQHQARGSKLDKRKGLKRMFKSKKKRKGQRKVKKWKIRVEWC